VPANKTIKSKKTSIDAMLKQLVKNTAAFQSKTIDLISEISKQNKNTTELISKMDKMLTLFEDAAKQVGETKTTDEQISSLSIKLENLLEQNKIVARGLLLLEEYIRGKTSLPKKPLI